MAKEHSFGSPEVERMYLDQLQQFGESYYLVSNQKESERLNTLLDAWEGETAFLSFDRQAKEHPLFRKIISSGEEIIPLILARLENKASHLFIALPIITGEVVDLKGELGIKSAIEAWLEWGREKGYLESAPTA